MEDGIMFFICIIEMRMLCWMSSETRRDKIRNDNIREGVGVAPMVEKTVEVRLRWFGHVGRRSEDFVIRVDKMENIQITRGKGRFRKTIRKI